MTTDNARVHISVSSGTIEIEGTENFVTAQINRFEPYIKSAFDRAKKTIANNADALPGVGEKGPNDLTKYSNLFAVSDGEVKILKDLPGDSKAQKTVSAALLMAFANTFLGVEATSYDTIRDICNAHACLDSANFSKTLKAEKEIFIIGGTSKRQTLTLSMPGKRKAEEMAKKLSGE